MWLHQIRLLLVQVSGLGASVAGGFRRSGSYYPSTPLILDGLSTPLIFPAPLTPPMLHVVAIWWIISH